MIRNIIILILISTPAISKSTKNSESLKFLKREASKSTKNYRYNEYESIISGTLAFLVGNFGYHETDSASLKLAYSGIQTIGIVNVGQGIYDYYRPIFDKELYLAIKRDKDIPRDVVKLLAKEERAKRLSLYWQSSLLAVQYFANAYLGDTEDNLKDVYKFLGGVNLIVIGYASFYRGKYENYYFERKTSLTPVIFKIDDKKSLGLNFQYRF